MIGRERELDELREHFVRLRKGNGGLVLLAGEAGVGKTRLAEAAVAAVALRACAASLPSEDPLRLRRSPWCCASISAGTRRAVRGRPSRRAPRRVVTRVWASTDATDRETLVAAVRCAFETIAGRTPTVVVLDDLQWADAASLEVLPTLAEAAEEWSLLLLGAYRSEEIPRGHPLRRLRTDLRRAGRLVELVVEPLDSASTALLAARVLDDDPGPALRAAIYDRTQGVPFFVEELAAALRTGAGSGADAAASSSTTA